MQEFNTTKEALQYIKENIDYKDVDEMVEIRKKPDANKFVVANLDVCSFLHRKGYKEVMNSTEIYRVLEGDKDFSDVVTEV